MTAIRPEEDPMDVAGAVLPETSTDVEPPMIYIVVRNEEWRRCVLSPCSSREAAEALISEDRDELDNLYDRKDYEIIGNRLYT